VVVSGAIDEADSELMKVLFENSEKTSKKLIVRLAKYV